MKHIICLVITALLFVASSAHAEATKRRILAVIDGNEVTEDAVNILYKRAAMPLEHLGFVVNYVDVTKRLPDDDEMATYKGIISWFTDNQLEGAANYARWITHQLNQGKKLVVIDNFGFNIGKDGIPIEDKLLNAFYKAFGVQISSADTAHSPLLIQVVSNDPAMTEFERKLGNELTSFEGIIARNAKVYLKLRRRDTKSVCDAVFTNPHGGMVLGQYALYVIPATQQMRWRIDPFKFFAEAFGSDFPKPDVSTINGMRLMYSHIDGDGARNKTSLEKGKLCYEEIYDKVLLKYKLPITLAAIVGDFMKSSGKQHRERMIKTFQKSYALPNVFGGSHGWAHPLEWKTEKMAIKLSGYEYSPENEIGKSIDWINEHLLPKGKKTDLFLWTGDTEPDYEALKYVYDHGIKNLNGGDSRYDSTRPSYAYIAPLFRQVSGLNQVLASSANEYSLTNSWKGPFYGYKYIIETFKNTESPMRLRPIGIYYNLYSMEYNASLKAIYDAYAYALGQEITPVTATDYVDVALGFRSAEIEKASDNKWIINNNGALRTIRFDDESRHVDLQASRRVLGYTHHQGSLYVHMKSEAGAEIVLTSAKPTAPYVAKANGTVKNWQAEDGSAVFTLRTIGRVHFVLGGMKKGHAYTVTARDETYKITSDSEGNLAFYIELPTRAFEDVEIMIE